LVDERSQAITIDPAGNVWLERWMRNAVAVLGGCACAGLYPMSGADMRGPVISGTISAAVRIGRAIRTAHGNPFEALNAQTEVYPLITGKVIDVERRTAGGFVHGSAVIEGTEADSGRL